jgi:hypothetical protein
VGAALVERPDPLGVVLAAGAARDLRRDLSDGAKARAHTDADCCAGGPAIIGGAFHCPRMAIWSAHCGAAEAFRSARCGKAAVGLAADTEAAQNRAHHRAGPVAGCGTDSRAELVARDTGSAPALLG